MVGAQAASTTPIVRRRRPTGTIAPARATDPASSWPLLGVRWSVSYAAFLAYVAGIVMQRVAIGTVAMGVALCFLPFERQRFRFPPIAAWMVVLAGWAAIGMTTTDHPAVVADHLIELAKVTAIVLVAVNVVTTRERLRGLLVVTVAAFAIYPMRGTLLNYLGGYTLGGRALWNAIYANPNDLAGLSLLQLAIVVGLVETERKWVVRAGAMVSAFLLPTIILLTQSRAVFIATAFCALVVAGRHLRNVRAIVLLSAVLVGVAFAVPDTTWKRIATIAEIGDPEQDLRGEAESSTAQRLEVWKVARRIIADHPLMGVGLGAYASTHNEYARRTQFDPIARGGRDTHSTYLNLLAEVGPIGLACFLAIVAGTLLDARRVRRGAPQSSRGAARQLFYLEVGAYGYLIAAIWGSYGGLVFTYFYFAIIYVAASILDDERTPVTPAPRRGPVRGRGAHHAPVAGALRARPVSRVRR